jgi:hypothetical protein
VVMGERTVDQVEPPASHEVARCGLVSEELKPILHQGHRGIPSQRGYSRNSSSGNRVWTKPLSRRTLRVR